MDHNGQRTIAAVERIHKLVMGYRFTEVYLGSTITAQVLREEVLLVTQCWGLIIAGFWLEFGLECTSVMLFTQPAADILMI